MRDRSRGELGGAKAQRTDSMTFMVLARGLELFLGMRSKNLGLRAASRHRLIAFDPEGSPLDRCLGGNNAG
jgi:hypothetical protein